MTGTAMNEDDFAFISHLLKKHSGLSLPRDKLYLLESRLQPMAAGHGHATITALIKYLRDHPADSVIGEVAEAMTTNESSFFRDNEPFEKTLQHLVRLLSSVKKRPLRLWSAACAGGQEPYSLAMALSEHTAFARGGNYEIIATDISARMIAKAKTGLYSAFEVQRGLSGQGLNRYFTRDDAGNWQVCSELKETITFHTHNLLKENPLLGRFDAIWCRNVLLYFDTPTKRRVLTNLSRRLQPKGILILGNSENIEGASDLYSAVENETGMFRLKV